MTIARRPKRASASEARAARAPAPRKAASAQHRLSVALRLLAGGARYNEVQRELVARFGVAASTAKEDIRRAYQQIAADDAAELPQLKARISARLWRIAVSAERDRKYHAASTALARLAKLHGLDAPSKVAVEGLDPDQVSLLKALQMTPAERTHRIAELEAELGPEAVAEIDAELDGAPAPRSAPPSDGRPAPAAFLYDGLPGIP